MAAPIRQLLLLGFIATICARPTLDESGEVPPESYDATKCALDCKDRQVWKGYEIGKVFQYKFNHSSLMQNVNVDNNAVWLSISGKANIAVVSHCEMVLTVKIESQQASNFKTWDPANRNSPRQVFENIESKPLRFSYNDGQIKTLCPSNDEERVSLNLKRSILSNFQLSIPNSNAAASVTERDVMGDCSTEYTPVSSLKVTKTKELSSCTGRDRFYSPIQGELYTSEAGPNALPLLKSSFDCSLDFKVEGRAEILSKASCVEEHILKPFSRGSAGAKAKITSELTFVAVSSEIKALSGEALQKRTNLLYEHRSTEHCHKQETWSSEVGDSIECLERGELGVGESFASKAEDTLRKMCLQLKLKSDIRPDLPEHFMNLVKNLRGLNSADEIYAVHQKLAGDLCSGNDAAYLILKQYFHDALPILGTEAGIQVMTKFLNLQVPDISAADRKAWLSSLAFVRHPTRRMVQNLVPLLQSSLPDYSQVVLSMSSLIYHLCKNDATCLQDAAVLQVVEAISSPLQSDCQSATPAKRNEVLQALRAIGNMGQSTKELKTFYRCMANTNIDMETRVAAAQALRRMNCANEQFPFDSLIDIVKDLNHDSELRINAYISLMRCATQKDQIISTLIELLNQEKSQQVGSFIYSHLSNLAATNDDFKKDLTFNLKNYNLKNKFNLDPRSFSRNFEKSYFSEATNSGGKFESNVIFSPQSFLPRSISVNLTLDMFGRSMNLLEVGTRVQGVESIIESFMSSATDTRKPSNAQSANTLSAFLNSNQKTFAKPVESPSGSVYYRVFGNEMDYISLKGLFTETNLNLRNVLTKLAETNSIERAKSNVFIESVVSMPTVAGIPLLLKLEGISSTYLKMQSKANLLNIMNGKLDFNAQFSPSGAVRVAGSMSVDGFFAKTGIKLIANAHTSTAASFLVNLAGSELEIEMTPGGKDNQDVLSFTTNVVYYHHVAGQAHVNEPIAPPTQLMVNKNRCTSDAWKKVIGFSLCLNSQYYDASSNSPSFPLTGPSSVQLVWTKTDSHSAYKLSAKRLLNPNNLNILFDINTPGSQVARQFAVQLKRDITPSESTLEASIITPWRQAVLTGKFASPSQSTLRTAEVSLLVDKTRRYAMNGEISYTNSFENNKAVKIGMGSFKLTLPDRTEQPVFKYHYSTEVSTKLKVTVTSSLQGITVGGKLQNYEFKAVVEHGQLESKKSGSQLEIQTRSSEKKIDFHISRIIDEKVQRSATNRIQINVINNNFQLKSWHYHLVSRFKNLGPLDYDITVDQQFNDVVSNRIVKKVNPIDFLFKAKIQYRPQQGQRISGQGTLKYTSPKTKKEATLAFKDVILGWEENELQVKAAAQCKLKWSHGLSSEHHILYERQKNWKLLALSVLNEVKGSGQKDMFKIAHKIDSNDENVFDIKQEIAINVPGRVDGSFVHKFVMQSGSSTFKQVIESRLKRGNEQEKKFELNNVYMKNEAKHVVTSTIKLNGNQVSKIESFVKPSNDNGQGLTIKVKGDVNAIQFTISHKHKFLGSQYSKELEIEQLIDIPSYNVKYAITTEGKIKTSPQMSCKVDFRVKKSEAEVYGFSSETESVADSSYTVAVDQKLSIYAGRNKFVNLRKLRFLSSPTQVKAKYFLQSDEFYMGQTNKFTLASELQLESTNGYVLKFKNNVKGKSPFFFLLRAIAPSEQIDYESNYNAEYYKTDDSRNLKIEVKQNREGKYLINGKYEAMLSKTQDQSYKMDSELQLSTSFERVKKVEYKSSFLLQRSAISKMNYNNYVKINGLEVVSLKTNNELQMAPENLSHKSDLEVLYFGNALKANSNSQRRVGETRNNRDGLFSFEYTNVEGTNYKGAITTKYVIGKQYYNFIDAEIDSKFENIRSMKNFNIKLLHEMTSEKNGVPTEFNGKVTMKMDGVDPATFSYTTRHEISAEKILATFDVKSVGSYLFSNEYQFRSNFEYVKAGFPRVFLTELLALYGEKKFHVNLNYHRTENQIKSTLLLKSNLNRQINMQTSTQLNYANGFKTFDSIVKVKVNEQEVLDELLEWDIDSLLKVNRIVYKVTSQFDFIKMLHCTYNHDFSDSNRLVKFNLDRNNKNRVKIIFDYSSLDSQPKSIIINLQPELPIQLPHVLFSMERTGTPAADYKNLISLEIRPLLAPITVSIELLAGGPPKTFQGMSNANFGFNVIVNSPAQSLTRFDLLYAMSADSKVKIHLDLKPLMTDDNKLIFEGTLTKTNNDVLLNTVGRILGRSITLNYKRNTSPLTSQSSLELLSDNNVITSYQFDMIGSNSIKFKGKSVMLFMPIALNQMYTLNFEHTAVSNFNFETKLVITNPQNEQSSVLVKMALPTYQQIDLTFEVKTPMTSLKSLKIQLEHRHKNPVEILNDMNEKLTFSYETVQTSYAGEWTMALEKSFTQKFGVNQAYLKFLMGLKIPFTERREMNVALEFTGNVNKAKLMASLRPRIAKDYSFNAEYDVPNWSEYRQQAKLQFELELPEQPTKYSLNINRTPSLYSLLATGPLEAVKRLSMNVDKTTGIGSFECNLQIGLIEVKSDLAKFYYTPSTFTSAFVSLRLPTVPDLIMISVKRDSPGSLAVSYKRGFNTADLGLKYENRYDVKHTVMLEVEFSSSKFNFLGDFQHGKIRVNHEHDTQWLNIVHQSEVIVNRVSLVKLQGTINRNPMKTLEIQINKVGSYFDGTFTYSKDWTNKKAKLVASVDKISNIPQRYALIFEIVKDTNSLIKEFNLKVDIPSRLFVLRKKSEIDEVAQTRSCEFELALDQRRSQRLLVNHVYSTKDPNQRDISLDIKLPSRTWRQKIVYFRDASTYFESRNVRGSYSLAWDDSDPSKNIETSFTIVRNPGTSFNLVANVKSLFMRQPLVIKLDGTKHSEEKSTIDLFVSAGEADTNKLTLIRETPTSGEKIRVITVEFVSIKNNNPFINMKAVGDAKRGLKSQILLGFQLDATAHASILESPLSVKWIGFYEPMRRFVLSSTSGASLDLNYKPQPFGSKIVVFISNSRKEAARLTYERNNRTPKITVQLDRGIGYIVMKMPFVAPYYTPNEARIKFSIGLSDASTANILALVGPQNLVKSVSGWSKQTHNLGFFFLGAKLTPENLIKFSSKYRVGDVIENLSGDQIIATSTNAIYNLRSYLMAKITSDPMVTQFRTLRRSCLMSIMKTVTDNIDGSLITSNVQQLFTNDYDVFMRFVQRMVERNEFFSSHIVSGFVTLKSKTDYYISVLSQAASATAARILTGLSGIAESMQQRRLQIRNSINANWVNLQRAISDPSFLNNIFQGSRQIVDGILSKMQACFDKIEAFKNATRVTYSQFINQARAYISQRIAEKFPELVERVQAAYEFCKNRRLALLQFIQTNVIQPILSNADVQQMLANVERIRNLVNELRQSIQSYQLSDAFPNSKRLAILVQNRRETFRHLMAGNFKKAVQTFIQIELYKLNKFELLCPLATKEECDAAKWHAEIDGQFYLPIYISDFRLFRNRITGVAKRIKKAVKRIRNVGSKVYTDASTKVFDILTRIKEFRKGLRTSYFLGVPPFEASAYIVGGQRFVTFDGRHYDHAGKCSHILTHDFERNAFSIKANYAEDSKKASYYMWTSVAVRADGKTVEILANGQVTVDGVQQNLPYLTTESGGLTAIRSGNQITVERSDSRDFSLSCFISHKFCRVTVSRWLYNQVGGLLGTFDNEQFNDFMLPSRQILSVDQLDDFTNVWAVGNCAREASSDVQNNVIPSQCKELFESETSQFSNCFGRVNAEPLIKACANEHLRDGTVCQTAALYITQCQSKGVVLQIPSSCIKCQLPNGELSAELSVNVNPVSESLRTRDYIFVMEASTCVKETLESIRHLSILLESSNSKFGLVLYGGSGLYEQPHQHLIGQNNLQCSGANFRTGLTKAESLFTGNSTSANPFSSPLAMSIRALRYASLNYPSQYGSGRNIILVKCANSYLGINEYAMTSRYLSERGISVHVLTSGDFVLTQGEETLYGSSSTHVFTQRDKSKAGRVGVTLGRTDLLASAKIPKDLSTALALRTSGGAVWNLKKLENREPQVERRNILKVVAHVVKASSNPKECVRCRCRLSPDNISSQLDCKLCQQKTNFNLWQIENIDST